MAKTTSVPKSFVGRNINFATIIENWVEILDSSNTIVEPAPNLFGVPPGILRRSFGLFSERESMRESSLFVLGRSSQ